MTEPAGVQLNDLRTLEECQALVRLQTADLGTGRRNGAGHHADGVGQTRRHPDRRPDRQQDALALVWSLPGLRHGIRTHWSHLLGVLPEFRGQGIAERLKAAQRNRAMAQDVDLVEWTFDPLLAPAAHLNLHVLGGVGANYGVDMYGTLPGEFCGGTPTDRLLVEWQLRAAHVKRRLALARLKGTRRRPQQRDSERAGADSNEDRRRLGALCRVQPDSRPAPRDRAHPAALPGDAATGHRPGARMAPRPARGA